MKRTGMENVCPFFYIEKTFVALSEKKQMYIAADFICRTLQISKDVFEK